MPPAEDIHFLLGLGRPLVRAAKRCESMGIMSIMLYSCGSQSTGRIIIYRYTKPRAGYVTGGDASFFSFRPTWIRLRRYLERPSYPRRPSSDSESTIVVL